MSKPVPLRAPRKDGRARTVYVCDRGHWHPNNTKAVQCNAKNRKPERFDVV